MANWNREWFLPLKTRACLADFFELLSSYPKAKATPGFQHHRSLLNQGFQTAHCPYRYEIERLWLLGACKLLEPAAEDPHLRHVAHPGGLFQEGPLLCNGFKQRNVKTGCNQFDGKSRKASTATNVEQAPV